MKQYAGILTGTTTAMIAVYVLIEFTEMELIHMFFAAFMAGFFAFLVFAIVTEPRKPRARWEKTGKHDELEVYIMGKTRR